MAITWTEDAESRVNMGPSNIEQQNRASFSASDYPTGGYPITGAPFGLGLVRRVIPVGYTGTASNYLWEYVPSSGTPGTGNLLVQSTPGTQVAALTDLSGGTVQLLANGF